MCALSFQDLFFLSQDVTVGLGPNGELRYPSGATGGGRVPVLRHKYMLQQLRRHAAEAGDPLWGLSGPRDSPDACGFFNDHGGSWQSAYGDFFLSWYAGQLVGHGDRALGDTPVEASAKVPFMHWWHGARSRPAEAVAGFYKSGGKNGYSPVAKMFARRGCTVIVPGMDVCMNKQHRITGSSPDQLLVQIKNACRRHGARIAGENASLVVTHTSSFSRIRSNVLTAERMRPGHFTYQRMGEAFFSPEHWPAFVEFVRGVVCGEWPDEDEDRDVADNPNAMEAQPV